MADIVENIENLVVLLIGRQGAQRCGKSLLPTGDIGRSGLVQPACQGRRLFGPHHTGERAHRHRMGVHVARIGITQGYRSHRGNVTRRCQGEKAFGRSRSFFRRLGYRLADIAGEGKQGAQGRIGIAAVQFPDQP